MFKRKNSHATTVIEKSEDAMRSIRDGIDRGLHSEAVAKTRSMVANNEQLEKVRDTISHSEPVERVRDAVAHLDLPHVHIEKKRKRRPYLLLVLIPAAAALVYMGVKKMQEKQHIDDDENRSLRGTTNADGADRYGTTWDRTQPGEAVEGSTTGVYDPSLGEMQRTIEDEVPDGRSWTSPEASADNQEPAGSYSKSRRGNGTARKATTTSSSVDNGQYEALIGRRVVDVDGKEIGTVESLYRRSDDIDPEWIEVRGGTLTERVVLAPLDGATIEDDVRLPYLKEQVDDTPQVEVNSETLSDVAEDQLYLHYNLRRMSQIEAGQPLPPLHRWLAA